MLPVICATCGSDRGLTIRSITHPPGFRADVVLVAYACRKCQHFSEHPALIADLSRVFARLDQTGDVLILGGRYMHCGQPMEKAGSALHRFSTATPIDSQDDESLDVYFSTRVLRCTCGFQMEIPE